MEITIIYKNGDVIGAYKSPQKALSALTADIMDCYDDITEEEIMAALLSRGSFQDFWYYDIIEVDMED